MPTTGLRTTLLLFLVALSAVSGCRPATQRRPLSGTATYQGKPLEDATITFFHIDGPPGPVCGALIRSGRYDIPAAQGLEPGTYRVSISHPVPGGIQTPEEKAAGASPKAQEGLPPQYNAQSKLTAEVRSDGPNPIDFNLE